MHRQTNRTRHMDELYYMGVYLHVVHYALRALIFLLLKICRVLERVRSGTEATLSKALNL